MTRRTSSTLSERRVAMSRPTGERTWKPSSKHPLLSGGTWLTAEQAGPSEERHSTGIRAS
jgi:hypothetical protein